MLATKVLSTNVHTLYGFLSVVTRLGPCVIVILFLIHKINNFDQPIRSLGFSNKLKTNRNE